MYQAMPMSCGMIAPMSFGPVVGPWYAMHQGVTAALWEAQCCHLEQLNSLSDDSVLKSTGYVMLLTV